MQLKRQTLAGAINLKIFGLHFLATLLVEGVVALIVFQCWFPLGLGQLAGGGKLFGLFAMGMVVCGPLLTALLYRSTKTRRALLVDAFLIAFLQGCAFLYGLNSLVQARPLALVFETDRFRLVTYADVPMQALPSLAPWVRPWSLKGLVVVGLRSAESERERAQRFDDMLADISPSQRPIYWQDLMQSADELRRRTRQLSSLRSAYPAQQHAIDQVVHRIGAREGKVVAEGLVWLPLVSRSSLDWVVLLDPRTFQPMAFLPLDGFI